jgi:plastocyanin
MRCYAIAAATAGVLSAAACSSSTSPMNGPVGGHSPQIEAVGSALGCTTSSGYNGSSTSCTFYFTPTPDTITVGTAVSFKFDDVEHQVVFDTPGGPASLPAAMNTVIQDGTPPAGTYLYHCAIHPYMHGTLVVQ